jgi:Phosphorylase superfamily
MRSVEILAPTFLEYWAVRRTLPHVRASWAGVRLARWKGVRQGSIVVVCGLAGAVAPGLPPGTVLVPDRVGLADGRIMHCDPTLVQALVRAARTLHFRPNTGPLLTAQSLIVGDDRHDWSQRGFVAADMETGLLAGRNLRVATIRVVLDSPEHGISPDWLRPTRALLQPQLWRELFWLSRVAPQYALRAAHVLKVGLDTGPGNIFAE